MESQKRVPKRALIFSLIGGALLILLTAAVILFPKAKQEWERPLGPALELPTQTATRELPTATHAVAGMEVETPDATSAPASTISSPTETTQAAIATATPKPLCGGPPSMVILGVGADSGQDYSYGLGDVIRVARVDFVTPKITVLSMPRDLWVEIPEISSNYGLTHGKLNQAYFYGGPGMGYYDGPGAGPGLLARTLDLNFGLRVDHYGAVNMQTFVKLVNAVGGIDLYLPTDVDGTPVDSRTKDMGYFTAGNHHFNGDEALRFSRIRKRYNDFTRMDNQNMVICALREKLVSPSVLPKIPQIISAFQGSVLTDLSPEQLGQLTCLLPSIERENLLFTSLPDEILETGQVYNPAMRNTTFVLEADNEKVRDYINQFLAGAWPNEPKEPTCP